MLSVFTGEDIWQSLLALALFTPLLLGPAWLLCHYCNPFQYQRLNVLRQIQLLLITSVSALPSADFFIAYFLGMKVAVGVHLVCALAAALLFGKAFLTKPSSKAADGSARQSVISSPIVTAILFAFVWLLLSELSLVDWSTSPTSIFQSITIHDYVKHTAITNAIYRTGVPPVSPVYLTKDKAHLFYYYYWFITVALVPVLTQGAIIARAAVIATTIWNGFATMALASFFAVQISSRKINRINVANWAAFLTFVTGLDFLPVGLSFLIQISNHKPPLFASIDWWNSFLINFSSSMLWVPQHTAAFVAGMYATFLLREMQKYPRKAKSRAFLTGLCISAMPGLSIYIAIVFIVAWAVWFAISVRRSKKQFLLMVIVSGALALLFSAPFIRDMALTNKYHGSQLGLWVRPLVLFSVFLPESMNSIVRNVLNALTLPLNYFLELGAFFVGSFLFWRGRKAKTDDEKLYLVALWVSFITGSFIRSTVHNNDFGYRATLPAQFLMLLWTAQVMAGNFSLPVGSVGALSRRSRAVMTTFIVIGLLGTAYDFLMLRFGGMVWKLRSEVGNTDGPRNFALREIYEDIRRETPLNVVLEHNPHEAIEVFSCNYSERQAAFSDEHYGTLMGTNPDEYIAQAAEVEKMFVGCSLEEMNTIRRKYGIDILIVRSTDPIWNKHDDVWTDQVKPRWQNDYGRAYDFTNRTNERPTERPTERPNDRTTERPNDRPNEPNRTEPLS